MSNYSLSSRSAISYLSVKSDTTCSWKKSYCKGISSYQDMSVINLNGKKGSVCVQSLKRAVINTFEIRSI